MTIIALILLVGYAIGAYKVGSAIWGLRKRHSKFKHYFALVIVSLFWVITVSIAILTSKDD